MNSTCNKIIIVYLLGLTLSVLWYLTLPGIPWEQNNFLKTVNEQF